jgi:hypothetical protein
MEVPWIAGIAAVALLTVASLSGALVLLAVRYIPPPNPNSFIARYFRAKQRAREQFWETLLGEDDKPDQTSHSK